MWHSEGEWAQGTCREVSEAPCFPEEAEAMLTSAKGTSLGLALS